MAMMSESKANVVISRFDVKQIAEETQKKKDEEEDDDCHVDF